MSQPDSSAGGPAPRPTAERLRLERLRAAASAFLRVRPWLAAFAGAANGLLLAAAGAPAAQRHAVGVTVALGVLAFAAEAWALRRRALSDAWLLASLTLTALALGATAALTGGPQSPLLPLLLAPAVVAVAAFERPRGLLVVVGTVLLVLGLLLAGPAWGPPVAAPWAGRMSVVSLLASLALSTIALRALAAAHRAVQEELERLRHASIEEAAARAREAEALGARVAHELRNPLAAIKALVQLTLREPTAPASSERLAVVLAEVERLERTLTEYLSLARPLTALEPEAVQLDAFLGEVAALFAGRALGLGVRVEVEARPIAVTADPRRLREAVINLCQNALSAIDRAPRGPGGERGRLRLGVHRDDDHVALVVADDGPGVEPELLDRLGQPFVAGRLGGTGLGVLHAASVARLHGGALTFAPAAGGGTVATLRLPLDGAAVPSAPPPPAEVP